MKKMLSIVLCLVFLFSTVLSASAVTYSIEAVHEVVSGDYIYLENVDFEDSDGDEPIDDLTNENFTVSRSFTVGKAYIEGIYFDDALERVVVVTDPNEKPDSDGQPLVGKITITSRDDSTRYTCKFQLVTDYDDDIKTYDYMIVRRGNASVDDANKKYYLPEDYLEKTTLFKTYSGTLVAEFDYYATFTVDFKNQDSLFLGYHNYIHPTLFRKLEKEKHSVDFGYISWYGNPVFKNAGTLEIEADGLEYLYLVTDGTKVSFIKGSYDEDEDIHVVKTNKLGQYLLTDEKLSFSEGTLTSTLSASPSSSSSVAPSSSSAAPSSSSVPPSSSSVAPSSSSAPPSSSSVVPSSSSVPPSSSSSEESSSEPEESSSSAPSSSSKPSSSSATQTVTPVEDDDKSSGLPITTIIIGAMAAIIVLLLVLLFVGPRKRSGFDDWDD